MRKTTRCAKHHFNLSPLLQSSSSPSSSYFSFSFSGLRYYSNSRKYEVRWIPPTKINTDTFVPTTVRFVDRKTSHLIAGDGGKGGLSFSREANKRIGPLDGGNGGDGGSIYVVGSSKINMNLNNIRTHYKAVAGGPGLKRLAHGKEWRRCDYSSSCRNCCSQIKK